MNKSAFITFVNLPDLVGAFSSAVIPAINDNKKDNITISVIGAPGVGKSYICNKLSEGFLDGNITTDNKIVPRDNMHDLTLWSSQTNGRQQVIQYDEASLRFVDNEYHELVFNERAKYPLPQRVMPGITFVEHPDIETESKSDIVMSITLSRSQDADITRVNKEILSGKYDIVTKQDELTKIYDHGCLITMNISEENICAEPLILFFDAENTSLSQSENIIDGNQDHCYILQQHLDRN